MVKQVKLKRDVKGYAIVIDLGAVAEMLKLSSDQIASQATIDVKLELKVCNNGKKVIISNKPQKPADPNPALIAALNSAHEIKKKYMASDTPSLSVIGSDIQMDARQVWRTLRLAYLAPDIQLAILSGMQPKGLLLKDLVYQSIPTSWQKQRSLFGLA